MDMINPEYNILKKAGYSFGFKHSKETILKFKARKNYNIGTGYVTTIINNSVQNYNSMRLAAIGIGTSYPTLLNQVNNRNKLLKGIFTVKSTIPYIYASKDDKQKFNSVQHVKVKVFDS